MASFNKTAFGTWLINHIEPPKLYPFGRGKCATHVRLALVAAGLTPAVHPLDAKDWGPTLVALGFRAVPSAGYVAKLGDIAVIQRTSQSTAGHIEGYDGKNWISDFVQREFWPGPSFRAEQPSFVIYRWPF